MPPIIGRGTKTATSEKPIPDRTRLKPVSCGEELAYDWQEMKEGAATGMKTSYGWTTEIRLGSDENAMSQSAAGKVKQKVDPSHGLDSTQMRPPCDSTALRQNVRPSPLPAYRLPCNRLNGSNIR